MEMWEVLELGVEKQCSKTPPGSALILCARKCLSIFRKRASLVWSKPVWPNPVWRRKIKFGLQKFLTFF
jgi:hypothetical protein